MFNFQKDHLFTLIKSMSKAEKRNFRLYVNRLQGEAKFVQLFDAIDRLKAYEEDKVLAQLPEVEKPQLPNLKRHLYQQILKSLRLIYINKDIEIAIHEQIDFARILYGKGMYMQALRILESTKRKAQGHHQDTLHLEILEFQKLIEARHITRSRRVANKMESLLDEAQQRSRIAHSSNLFSNFNIQMHGWYIEHGHVKSASEEQAVQAFFQAQLPHEQLARQLTFFEKANLYQAYFWHHYILLDFEGARLHAQKWVQLFQDNEQMGEQDPILYMRALYYLLVLHYLLRDEALLRYDLAQFEGFFEQAQPLLNENGQLIAVIYLNLSRLNLAFVSGQYEQALALVPGIKQELSALGANTDLHRILLFYYKFAYLHFGLGQYEQALDYLNEIIHLKTRHLRDDLLHNSRILHLLCHYELENYRLLDYLIGSVRRLFKKATDLSPLLEKTLPLLSELANRPRAEHPAIFARFVTTIEHDQHNPYEHKAVNYLDLLAWAKGHLKKQAKKI